MNHPFVSIALKSQPTHGPSEHVLPDPPPPSSPWSLHCYWAEPHRDPDRSHLGVPRWPQSHPKVLLFYRESNDLWLEKTGIFQVLQILRFWGYFKFQERRKWPYSGKVAGPKPRNSGWNPTNWKIFSKKTFWQNWFVRRSELLNGQTVQRIPFLLKSY
jgi:hypothetical protein